MWSCCCFAAGTVIVLDFIDAIAGSGVGSVAGGYSGYGGDDYFDDSVRDHCGCKWGRDSC